MRSPPRPGARAELALTCLLAWAALVAVPLTQGMVLSWDALNHHVYLGWTAFAPRFGQDFLAAGYQSTTYPYLYWPMWKLVEAGVGGRAAGLVLDTLYVLAVPPLWLLARRLVPEPGWWGLAMRLCAVALAFLSGVILAMLDSTANDLLAGIPLVWSVALAFEAVGPVRAWRPLLLSGALAGLAVAFKFSNGPLALVLPLVWVGSGQGWRVRTGSVIGAGAVTLLVFGLAYAPWGWQLWTWFGNPIYPFADGEFARVRALLGRP